MSISFTSALLILFGVAGCGLFIVAAVAVVWAVTHDRPPTKTESR